jgi:hypothetical protein
MPCLRNVKFSNLDAFLYVTTSSTIIKLGIDVTLGSPYLLHQ